MIQTPWPARAGRDIAPYFVSSGPPEPDECLSSEYDVDSNGGNGCGFNSADEAGSAAGAGFAAARFGAAFFAGFLAAFFTAAFFAAFFAGFFAAFFAAFFAFLVDFFAVFFFAATAFLLFLPFLLFAFFAFLALAIVVLLLPPILIDPAFQVFRFSAGLKTDQFNPGRGPPVAQSRSSIV